VASDISESFREQNGHHEVAEEKNGQGQPRGILDAHNPSAPLTTREVSAKNTTVRITNTRSGIQGAPVIR
jgi:hypothetical protein